MITISYSPTDDYDLSSVPFSPTFGGKTPQEKNKNEDALKFLQNRGLCPHDGKELALMLSGQKPAAIITMTPPVANEWRFWIGNQTMIARESPVSLREGFGDDEREMIIVLRTEMWRASSIELLLTKAVRRADVSGMACQPYERFLTKNEQSQLGDILGYEKKHLDAWQNEPGESWEETDESNISKNDALDKERTKQETKFGKFLDGIIDDPMAPAALRLFSAALSVAKNAVSARQAKKNDEQK